MLLQPGHGQGVNHTDTMHLAAGMLHWLRSWFTSAHCSLSVLPSVCWTRRDQPHTVPGMVGTDDYACSCCLSACLPSGTSVGCNPWWPCHARRNSAKKDRDMMACATFAREWCYNCVLTELTPASNQLKTLQQFGAWMAALCACQTHNGHSCKSCKQLLLQCPWWELAIPALPLPSLLQTQSHKDHDSHSPQHPNISAHVNSTHRTTQLRAPQVKTVFMSCPYISHPADDLPLCCRVVNPLPCENPLGTCVGAPCVCQSTLWPVCGGPCT